MSSASAHQPVMLSEAVTALNIDPDGIYLDATFGRGGHSAAILAKLGHNGRLLALDRDPEAAAWARQHFNTDTRFSFRQVWFGRLGETVLDYSLQQPLSGVLLDVGVSSAQLDDPVRGFSFSHDGPLDMRMDPDTGISVADWLAHAEADDISRVLWQYGEERYHRRIANAIIAARLESPIVSTGQLASLIGRCIPRREPGKHPATRSFQALRIMVNRELDELTAALDQALSSLKPGGRLVVICFHSLEDRIVKRFMRDQARGPVLPPGLPVQAADSGATLRLIGKAQRPSDTEIQSNPRARSAVMRIAERLE